MTQTERIVAAKSGDQESINILVAEHSKYIGFLARRYPRYERDDAIQYGNQAFLEALRDFDPNRGFRLITFASYRIRKGMQKAIRNMKEPLISDTDIVDSESSRDDDFDQPHKEDQIPAPEKRSIEKRLMDAIAGLLDIEREILKLHYFEGLTVREIGEIVKLSNQRVCQIEHRAIQKLKKELS